MDALELVRLLRSFASSGLYSFPKADLFYILRS